jgi:Na+/H+ antiporter NhaD/arsenite permease-like protein
MKPSPLLGAMVMLLIGIYPAASWMSKPRHVLSSSGLMITSTVADQAGFFSWCAFKSAKLAHGRLAVVNHFRLGRYSPLFLMTRPL